jgi:hypothetical protein
MRLVVQEVLKGFLLIICEVQTFMNHSVPQRLCVSFHSFKKILMCMKTSSTHKGSYKKWVIE